MRSCIANIGMRWPLTKNQNQVSPLIETKKTRWPYLPSLASYRDRKIEKNKRGQGKREEKKEDGSPVQMSTSNRDTEMDLLIDNNEKLCGFFD